MLCISREAGVKKLSVHKIIDQVWDTKNFNVGGGAASSISASMAAGLVGMVARLSLGKNYGLDDRIFERIAAEMDFLCLELQSGADEDGKAFLGIKAAFTLPKNTESEKKERREAVEKAAIRAAEVPLENGEKAVRIMNVGRSLIDRSNPAASSDLEIGIALARTAVIGCALNIDANLPLIKSPEKHNSLREASGRLKGSAEKEIV